MGERMAFGDGSLLLRFLKAVAEGRDDEDTGRSDFQVRMAAIACASRMAVNSGQRLSLFTHQPGTDEDERRTQETAVFATLRDLNLATWALCACDTFVSDARFRKGVAVRIRNLQGRTDLNGREGKVLGRAARVAGRAPRWRIEIDGNVIAARALNIEVRRGDEGHTQQ